MNFIFTYSSQVIKRLLYAIIIFLAPLHAFSQGVGSPGGGGGSGSGVGSPGGGGGTGTGVGSPGGGGGGGLTNPLQFETLESFLVAILDALILILFPFLVLALVYAGFMFVTAQGKPEALSKARTAFLWVLIGALVILGAKAIAIAIEATVDEITVYNVQIDSSSEAIRAL